MPKRVRGLGVKGGSHSHKTKKRLEIKKLMLAKKKSKKTK